jgi:Lon protease-like protein
MTRDCLDGDAEFGTVLIERGHEVGGGDIRFTIGTVARIVEAAMFDDGRWALVTVGTRRIEIVEWLADDPYPRAVVEDRPDVGTGAVPDGDIERAERAVRRALALKSELNEPATSPSFELADDPEVAGWQLAGFAPLGPVDHLRLLSDAEPAHRMALVAELCEEEASVLAYRLSSG